MRRRWIAASLTVVLCLAGQGTAISGPAALVAAEQAFAHDVAVHGVRAGFLAHLAPTAVVFAPGPVNARKLYKARAANAARLTWEPSVAVMSGAGDLGWTTGPWEWRRDSTQVAPGATGSFVTLWRRQPDGSLEAVLDMGVSHAPSQKPALIETRTLGATAGRRGALWQRHALWKADADFARIAGGQGLAAAIASAAAPQVRWLRDQAPVVVGKDAVRDSAAAHRTQGRMMSLAQFAGDGGDLGYTYGTFIEGNATAPDSSYYLHIWERAAGQPWQLVLELFAPVPRPGR